ncbi:IPTL-CTERM sorting domain-containing protein [Brevundimonas staleyi]|uniref:IPTL-CTERM sorting domain-containing protein n=1 Tax=Brevundimonas staleyi TaxID=74326 RepID=A0ABW0FU24_9CAUL
MKTLALSAAVAAVALVATPALAVPVQWTINGTFQDGGTIGGTFIYDYDTNTYSSINITTTAGTTLTSGANYVALRGTGGSNGLEVLTAGGMADGQRVMYLSTTGAAMNNSGGVRNFNTGLTAEGTCTGGGACSGAYGTPRSLTGGTVTGVVLAAPVPTLTEWAMIGLTGLLATAGAVMVMRRRQTVAF